MIQGHIATAYAVKDSWGCKETSHGKWTTVPADGSRGFRSHTLVEDASFSSMSKTLHAK